MSQTFEVDPIRGIVAVTAVGSRGVASGATGTAIEYYDRSTGRTVHFLDVISGPQTEMAFVFSATLAQINAGLVIMADDPFRTIIPVGFRLLVTGAFTTLTDVRLSDTAGSPVDIVTIAQAQLTNGAVFGTGSATGVTFGAGFAAPVTAGKGIQIRKTGSSGAGGTSISGVVHFILG